MSILSPRELKASSKARLDLQMRGLCVRVKESRTSSHTFNSVHQAVQTGYFLPYCGADPKVVQLHEA